MSYVHMYTVRRSSEKSRAAGNVFKSYKIERNILMVYNKINDFKMLLYENN